MNRPEVDESKCFLCQEKEPTELLTREGEDFRICADCRKVVESELRIRKILYQSDLFRMTLGAPLPPSVRIKKI